MYGPMGIPELLIIVVFVGGGLFWLWMLVDCVSKEDPEHRVLWVLIIVFTNLLGALAYFFARRLPRVRGVTR